MQAGIAALDKPGDEATTVLCLCDPVAPAFVYKGEQDNAYYPENVLADVQNMGTTTWPRPMGRVRAAGPVSAVRSPGEDAPSTTPSAWSTSPPRGLRATWRA